MDMEKLCDILDLETVEKAKGFLITAFVTIIGAIILLVYASIRNDPERLVRKAMALEGYDMTTVQLEKMEMKDDYRPDFLEKGVYRCSYVITDRRGQKIEYWQFINYSSTISCVYPFFEENMINETTTS